MQQRLGRYELVERIASGGQGIVWRALDTVLDRIVAIKVLNQPVADDRRYLEALQREARLAAGLVHPNITAVHDFQVEGNIAYIVMEYVPDTLANHLQNRQPLTYQRAVEITMQICRALSHAHEQGIIHRDIKLQNILLTNQGEVKVSDFGIARALASSTRSSATGTMGTPFYMSPEQWGGTRVDGRSDIYSLGILLYEMLTGSVPFRAENIGAMYVQHRESAIPEISSELGIPAAVEAVMRMALEKDPENRLNSAETMANALQRSLNPESMQGQPDSTDSRSQRPPPLQGPPSGYGRFPRWLIFGGAGVLLLSIVLVVIGFGLRSSDLGDKDGMVGMLEPANSPELPPTSLPTYTLFPTVTPSPTNSPELPPTSLPTYTPFPIATPGPTNSPELLPTSLPTYTPFPTATPRPTYTPAPTYTPYPTATSTPPTARSELCSYTLEVSQGSDTRIMFKAGRVFAYETITWQPGGMNVLNLTFSPPLSYSGSSRNWHIAYETMETEKNAWAQVIPPHLFVGYVKVNGLSAPAGTEISAIVDGIVRGYTTVSSSGSYQLEVHLDQEGAHINFMIDTLLAYETATWSQGDSEVLDLSADSSGPRAYFNPTPTPAPSPTPAPTPTNPAPTTPSPTPTPTPTPIASASPHILVGTANVATGTIITAVINGLEKGSAICR